MAQEILLDTNILSELMRPQPDVRVLSWFGLNTEAGYYISAVTQAEILLGISLLPAGKRQTGLTDAAAESNHLCLATRNGRISLGLQN